VFVLLCGKPERASSPLLLGEFPGQLVVYEAMEQSGSLNIKMADKRR